MGYSAAARGGVADVAAAAVGTAAAVAGTWPATRSSATITVDPCRVWHELRRVYAGDVDVCNLKDVQVESPQGNEENAYACSSYHGVFALLFKPLQHTLHRLAPTDFHGAG